MIRRTNQQGFTLLELLVVITVLGLLMVALTNGVRFAGQAWEMQQRRSMRQGDLDAVQNVLRQLIMSGTGFEGNASALRFVAAMPAALARGGLYDIELTSSAGSLVLRWTPHFKGPDAAQARAETVLARNVAGFEMGYYRAPGGWRTISESTGEPPLLIRIAFKATDGRAWPPLVVAPSIELQAAATN